jgi:hypothetical protein
MFLLFFFQEFLKESNINTNIIIFYLHMLARKMEENFKLIC